MRKSIAKDLYNELKACVAQGEIDPSTPYSPNVDQAEKRARKNFALSYLASLGEPDVIADCKRRFDESKNMTDTVAALGAVMDKQCDERTECLKSFEEKWTHDPLVMQTWLSLQAASNMQGNLSQVKELINHPSFSETNPNCLRALIAAFTQSTVNFHAEDESGYDFLTEWILKVDKINPIMAGGLTKVYSSYRAWDPSRQEKVRK